jgi:hypothetical protein
MTSIHRISVIALAGAALAVSSCSPGGRSPSGFLGNYKQMDAGYGTADAVSSYLKPDVDLKQYHSVMIDPVTTVVATSGISSEVKEQLAANLAYGLQSQAEGKLKVVGAPGPGVLRIRAALTDVVEGRSTGKPVTTVHSNPQTVLTGILGSEQVAAFISHVSFEGEVLDSVTGERISALCDHRLGAKREATAKTSWAAVRSASNQAAGRLWQRFSSAQSR